MSVCSVYWGVLWPDVARLHCRYQSCWLEQGLVLTRMEISQFTFRVSGRGETWRLRRRHKPAGWRISSTTPPSSSVRNKIMAPVFSIFQVRNCCHRVRFCLPLPGSVRVGPRHLHHDAPVCGETRPLQGTRIFRSVNNWQGQTHQPMIPVNQPMSLLETAKKS